MAFAVLLTDDAARDLEECCEYIREHDTPEKSEQVLARIEQVCATLAKHPNRGNYPKELIVLGIREYREVRFKPYRILYRVVEKTVYVLVVADGQRDMQALLQRRLLLG